MQIIDWLLLSNASFFSWLTYSVICLPIVFFMMLLLPLRYTRTWYLNFAFFYLLSLSMYLIGIILTLIIILILAFSRLMEKNDQHIQTAEYPDFQRAPIKEYKEYGEGYGFKVVTTQNLPKSVREKMLVAINQFGTSSVNKINAIALSDYVDEIRLYAQSLIEKQERQISQKIKLFMDELSKAKDEKHAAVFKKLLAEILWEQVYKYLIKNENLPGVLQKIQDYAEESLSILPNDAELPILLTKISLRRQNLEDAKRWLQLARENQSPDYKVISYLAEIKFLEKKFTEVKNLLHSVHHTGILGIQPNISFWVKHD